MWDDDASVSQAVAEVYQLVFNVGFNLGIAPALRASESEGMRLAISPDALDRREAAERSLCPPQLYESGHPSKSAT
jgi:hypothetical protein